MPRIIAFAGLAGSGKDTAAAVILEQLWWERRPLAGPLKAMLATLMKLRGCHDPETYTDGNLATKQATTPWLNNETPRRAMQLLGTEFGRALSPTLWLDTWRDGMLKSTAHGVVVTDVRFANEAEYLKKLGAEIYLVRRPGFVGGAGQHASEDLSWAEGLEVIWNDFQTAEEFQDSVRARFFS